jgi:hypothetical protein
MRSLFLLLCVFSFVAQAQESQPSSQPASTSQPTNAATVPYVAPLPEKTGPIPSKDTRLYLQASGQAMPLIFYNNGGIEGGLGIMFKQKKGAPQLTLFPDSLWFCVEANGHAQISFFAFQQGAEVVRYGGDLSLRVIKNEQEKPGILFRTRAITTAFRIGLGGEQLEVGGVEEFTSTTEYGGYGVVSMGGYLTFSSVVSVGGGVSGYLAIAGENLDSLNARLLLTAELLQMRVIF